MEITSFKFVILAIASVFIYFLLNKRFRIVYLTLLSCGFIATYNRNLLIYVITYSFVNYFFGRIIQNSGNKTALFRTGIILNLIQLFVINYASFAIDPIFRVLNSNIETSKLTQFIIPIGLSYFTLQGIGYLINIKMGWEKPEKNFLHFLLYITFYPKYLSGPVERSNHFLPQLNNLRPFSRQNVSEGFRLVLLGLIKKIVIANQLSLIVNPVYDTLDVFGGGKLLIVILIQPLYLYFDFSGYTDIAMGIAKAYGIDLLPNFNRPFFAENVTTFWKRFHMSLAFWFNDYVFKQSSFRLRKWKSFATIAALFITWTLFGIWHGAGWNFMILGLLQALAISFEFFTKTKRQILFSKISPSLGKWTGRFITYLFYGVSLVFFFSPDLKASLQYFEKLKSISISLPIICSPITGDYFVNNYVEIFSYSVAIGILILFMVIEGISSDMKVKYERILNFWSSNNLRTKMLRYALYYFAILLLFYFGGSQTEFVYFQF